MRVNSTNADLRLARRSLLLFTTEQAELIRSRMAGSLQ
jgi:hypothetical protein